MQTVLLTAIGSVSGYAAYQSLKAAGYRVIGCDIYPMAWNVTSGEADAFFNVPLTTVPDAYASALLEAVKLHHIDFIIPLTDVEVDVLCTRKAEFEASGALLCCLEPQVADLCRDKLHMADVLNAAGLCSVIPTYTAQTLPNGAPYPLFVKPLKGRSSQGQMIIPTPQALAQALTLRDDYIIQPFCPGEVYAVDCARDRHGNMATMVRKEVLRTVNGLGTSVEICPEHPLNAICQGILTHADIVGVVNMEFIHHNGQFLFLEVNPRFSGGIGFSVLAGYDFPLAMLHCHQGLPLAPMPTVKSMTLVQRYEMHVTKA